MPRERVRPEVYFVGSAIFHYLGPAFAVLLFARVDPLGVAWLRIASAAAVFALWRRPWRALRSADRQTKRLLAALGAVFATMNSCFYLAIDHLPLGTVAAIEFLPVIVLAAAGTRTVRNAAALALAVSGVYVLTDVRLEGDPIGVAFAFANAALFAVYIVLAHRVARSTSLGRIDGLAAAMLLASVAITPIGGLSAAHALLEPAALAAGVGVGIASSVVPYVLDQLAMARLTRASYALLVSLLPATATVIGVLVLSQIPSAIEALGVVLVIVAVALHREQPASRAQPRPRANETSERPDGGSTPFESSGCTHDGEPRRREVAVLPELLQPQLDAARQQRCAGAQGHGRDRHDDLVEQPDVGELPGEVSSAGDPDVPAGGGSEHPPVHRCDVVARELDRCVRDDPQLPVREDPARNLVWPPPLGRILVGELVVEDPLVRCRAHRHRAHGGKELAVVHHSALVTLAGEQPVE
jgi:inner membrane transporter RhtA